MGAGTEGETADQQTGSGRGPGQGRIRRAVAAWLRLARFVNSQQAALSVGLRENRLSLAQFDILAQIGAAEGLTQRELADRLVVTQGNVTQLLQKLERQGLVERPPSGRCNRVRLTPSGSRLRARVVPAHERRIAELFCGLTSNELESLSRLLRKITRAREQRECGARSPGEGQEDTNE